MNSYNDKNLEQIVQEIPEAKRILDLSWRNSEKDGTGRKYGELTVKELESFTKAIIRHRMTTSKRKNMEWISTGEKLPPNDTRVLVYGFRKYEGEKDILGNEKTFVCEAKHFHDGCFVKGVNVEIYATHWQPLPKPPTK